MANQFDLPGSQFVFDVSEDPPMRAHTTLSQDGFYHKGLWVDHPLTSLPFDLQGAFLCMCGWGGLLTWKMREMWPEQGPASCLNCPALLVLEFQFTGNESPIVLPWQGGGGCLPQADQGDMHSQPRGLPERTIVRRRGTLFITERRIFQKFWQSRG